MKTLPWILVALLGGLLLWSWFRPPEPVPAEWRVDTIYSSSVIVRRDTVPHYLPMPLLCWHTGDTIHVNDIVLQVEQKVYKDSNYTAYVSGYRPQLDSISVYPITTTVNNDIYHTIKVKGKHRWGIGLQVGYGYPIGSYIGIGISYNLLYW